MERGHRSFQLSSCKDDDREDDKGADKEKDRDHTQDYRFFFYILPHRTWLNSNGGRLGDGGYHTLWQLWRSLTLIGGHASVLTGAIIAS